MKRAFMYGFLLVAIALSVVFTKESRSDAYRSSDEVVCTGTDADFVCDNGTSCSGNATMPVCSNGTVCSGSGVLSCSNGTTCTGDGTIICTGDP